MSQRQPRKHDEAHLKFIRTLPCRICMDDISTEAAHVRCSDISIAKPMTGIATKPHDMFTVPLCSRCHRDQHQHEEKVWWRHQNIDPVKTALALYVVSGDCERGLEIVRAGR